MTIYKSEYIWSTYSGKISSVTKVYNIQKESVSLEDFPPITDCDPANPNSEIILIPAKLYSDPTRGNGIIVLCEMFNSDASNHPLNSRREFVERLSQTDVLSSNPIASIKQYFVSSRNNNSKDNNIEILFCIHDFVEDFLNILINSNIQISESKTEELDYKHYLSYYVISGNTILETADNVIVSRFILSRLIEKYSNLINFSTSTLNLEELQALKGPKYKNYYITASMSKVYDTKKILLMPIMYLNKYTKEDVQLNYINKFINSLCPEEKSFYSECYNQLYVWNNGYTADYTPDKIEESHANVKATLPTKLAGNGFIYDERPIAMSDPYKVLRKIMESSVLTEIQK